MTGGNVADLLDHVTGGNRFTVAILSGMTAADAREAAHTSFTGEHDPVEAVLESTRRQFDSFALPTALDQTYDHVAGKLSGITILRIRLHDVMVHLWDLEQALQPGAPLHPGYARWAIADLSKPDSPAARHLATEVKNPKTAADLLTAFGRTTPVV